MANRMPPAIDFHLNELLSLEVPPKRARITGILVSIDSEFAVLNDGEAQITLRHYFHNISDYEPSNLVRAIIDIIRVDNKMFYKAIAIHTLSKKNLEQYKKIISLERRIGT
jgi:hypothetical protein